MYMMWGPFMYTQEVAFGDVTSNMDHPVVEGTWICEAALWSFWTHVGRMMAESMCQILCISVEGLDEIQTKHHFIARLTKCYGRSYHERILVSVPPHADWPDDLFVPFTDFSDLMSAKAGVSLLRAKSGRSCGMTSARSSWPRTAATSSALSS